MAIGKAIAKPVIKAAGEATEQVFESGAKVLGRLMRNKTIPKEMAPATLKTLEKHINLTKGTDVADIEYIFKGMKDGHQEAFGAFEDFYGNIVAQQKYNDDLLKSSRVQGKSLPPVRPQDQGKEINPNTNRPYAYKAFDVDQKLPWEDKKKLFKDAANKRLQGTEDSLKDFMSEQGQLRDDQGDILHLKPRQRKGMPKDYQPKPKATTAKAENLRKQREITQTTDPKNLGMYRKIGGHHKTSLEIGGALTENAADAGNAQMEQYQKAAFIRLLENKFPIWFGNHPLNLQPFEGKFTESLHTEVHNLLDAKGLKAEAIAKELKGKSWNERYVWFDENFEKFQEVENWLQMRLKDEASGIMHSPTGRGDQAFDNTVKQLQQDPSSLDRSGFGGSINISDRN